MCVCFSYIETVLVLGGEYAINLPYMCGLFIFCETWI